MDFERIQIGMDVIMALLKLQLGLVYLEDIAIFVSSVEHHDALQWGVLKGGFTVACTKACS